MGLFLCMYTISGSVQRQIPLLFYRLAGSRCQPSPLGEGARGPARGRMRGSPSVIPRSRSAFRKPIPHPALRGHLPPLGGRQSCRPFTGKAPPAIAAAHLTFLPLPSPAPRSLLATPVPVRPWRRRSRQCCPAP